LFLKAALIRGIAVQIPIKFRSPVVNSRAGYPSFPAAGMLMPKTSVHEDHFPESRKNNVRMARQILAMQAESVAQAMDQTAEDEFRIGIFASYTPHVGASLVQTELVHRGLS
jgi:hypothetical protein